MRLKGFEPPRAFAHTDLNRARIPVPPQPRDSQLYSGALLLDSDIRDEQLDALALAYPNALWIDAARDTCQFAG